MAVSQTAAGLAQLPAASLINTRGFTGRCPAPGASYGRAARVRSSPAALKANGSSRGLGQRQQCGTVQQEWGGTGGAVTLHRLSLQSRQPASACTTAPTSRSRTSLSKRFICASAPQTMPALCPHLHKPHLQSAHLQQRLTLSLRALPSALFSNPWPSPLEHPALCPHLHHPHLQSAHH